MTDERTDGGSAGRGEAAGDGDPLLAEARWLPHLVELDKGQVTFLPTAPALLRTPAFIDGRSDFATGAARRLGIEEVLGARVEAPGPDRMIFHMSFCGSTLLARLLDRPGAALVLREPNALADLANWKTALAGAGRRDPRLGPLVDAVRALLRRRWKAPEAVVVKPSNWANALLPELCAEPARLRPLFVTIGRRRFLRAVFRGGRERIAYTVRAAAHLAPSVEGGAALVAAAAGGIDDALGRAARLAAAAHLLQQRLFGDAMRSGGWDMARMLDLDELEADRAGALARAATVLDLPSFADGEAAAAIDRLGGLHAKEHAGTGGRFDAAGQAAGDAAVEAQFGALLADAEAWADRSGF